MANLLPIEAQQNVWQRYLARFIVALALLLLAATLIFVLALLPSYLAIVSNTAAETTDTATQRSTTDVQAIARAQLLVSQLYPALTSEHTARTYVSAAVSAMPSGVTLTHVGYNAPVGTTPATITLTGNATRERVAAFRDALVASPLFASASVPVSALVGSSAGQFSITVTVENSQKTP